MRTLADRYQITAPLGRGGMGEVWEGLDLRLNRQVAIKLINTSTLLSAKDARRRFNREARVTARLRHPGVPVIYDFGDDGDLYMVMESLQGDTVGKLKDELGPLPTPWATYICAQVAAVLTAAHTSGLVHRDLKPENLLLCEDGTIKVIDFGVATAPGIPDFSRITQSGEIAGTTRYLAPELLEGHPATRASDLYTLGCVLHELLTGTRPYQSQDLLTEITRTREAPPPPMPDTPKPLETLTHHLLSKSPADRPPSAASIYRTLTPWIRDPRPIPGWITDDLSTDPVHMYSSALAKLR